MTENLPATPSNVPPGWYPHTTGELRWWDGEQWTEQTHVPTRTEQAKRSSKAAFWSMLLGIPALLGVPLALIFVGFPAHAIRPGWPATCHVAFGDIRRGAAVGLGMAWAGLILNGLVWMSWAGVPDRHRHLGRPTARPVHPSPGCGATSRPRPGPSLSATCLVGAARRPAFDSTLPASEALGRIRDASNDYDRGVGGSTVVAPTPPSRRLRGGDFITLRPKIHGPVSTADTTRLPLQ